MSLLPIVSRLLEKCVQRQLVSYLQEYDLFPPSQFAFRFNHSTEDALVLAVNRWQHAKYERKTTGIVMIDMSKAFDHVRHSMLVLNLFSLGVQQTALRWLASYLSDRVRYVKVSSKLSASVKWTRVVPQGSVLGPLLFTLYIRDLAQILPAEVHHQEFADDILLDCSLKMPGDVSRILTNAVAQVAVWLDEIGHLLNTRKNPGDVYFA